MFAKISWELVKGINHTIDAKPNSVNWVTYTKALLGIYDGLEEYKIESISNYRLALFHKTETIGNDHFSIVASFFVFIILLLLIYVIWYSYKRKLHEESLLFSNCIIYVSMLLFFIFGLGGVYMDKFVYTESVALASYPRYMNTVINILFIEIVIMLLLHYGGRKLNVISIMLILQATHPEGFIGIMNAFPLAYMISTKDETGCGLDNLSQYMSNNIDDEVDVTLHLQTAFYPRTKPLKHYLWPVNVVDGPFGAGFLVGGAEMQGSRIGVVG